MKTIWLAFCMAIFTMTILYILFYPIIFAVENNAPECIFAEDTVTCTQLKRGLNK